MLQRSLSPIYQNDEDYLKPKIPQITQKMPQFCQYYKENIQYPSLIQTVRKKQIFDQRNVNQQNISPIRTNQIQFRVSQPKSPIIRQKIDMPLQSRSQTSFLHQMPTSLTPPKKQNSKILTSQTIIPQHQNPQLIVKTPLNEQIKSQINNYQMQSQNYQDRGQQKQMKIDQSQKDIYSCLQEELQKSEMKLKQLTERSQQMEEKRIQLRNTFKNSKLQQKNH
ncbi:unnamed protein product (macronuclear) [Paramecium tetraurelia]|uniref:Uncharacterized protein n=1 Tax=Paramecium tetraurelia TaxID=5888 RepID=A0E0W5_PARTE|nr:uncharacterized protein GSPATT00022100001 [Paramecium tetraurelia]CAK88932.1 unnamed protein product [Paramecium tetraurelia]|eukprot:XP_001456329.1 hypothetical protein (macronuclear) [Paramecium tetraurelia strain d4-2]